MARVDIVIPEPTSSYTEENQSQVTQSLRTMQDKLNTISTYFSNFSKMLSKTNSGG